MSDYERGRADEREEVRRRELCESYANYPTFTVALWIDNDRYRQERTRVIATSFKSMPDEHPDVRMAEWLRSYVDRSLPDDTGSNVGTSFLDYALSTVDWLQLARHYMNEE